ncbi:MAG: single-stranded DNA-binding protein, partial [Candidatus Dependentiae bacterium]
KQLSSGQAVCRLGLASNRSFKNRQTGEYTQEVCFIDVDVWGPQADNCQQYLQKGRGVLIEGRLKFDTWDQDGVKRSKHSVTADRVTFMSSANDDTNASAGRDMSSAQDDLAAAPKKKAAPKSDVGEVDMSSQQKPFEDDLPF